jgi:hypothetical protein
MRYLLTFVCEFFYSWRMRHTIQSEGCHNGSLKALLFWCHTCGKYSHKNHHPLWICVNRGAFVDWMND